MMTALELFTKAYIESALWTGTHFTDEYGEENLDHFVKDNIAEPTLTEMVEDCKDFYEANQSLLAGCDPSHAGHDFNLTRNRHGAGFWDGDYPTMIGKQLTEAAHVYGTFALVLYSMYNDDTNQITHHN